MHQDHCPLGLIHFYMNGEEFALPSRKPNRFTVKNIRLNLIGYTLFALIVRCHITGNPREGREHRDHYPKVKMRFFHNV